MNEKGQRSGCSKIVLPALKGKKVGVWTEIDHPTLSVFETRTLSSLITPSLHLRYKPENIFYYYNDPDSEIVIDFEMWIPYPFYSLFIFPQSKTPPFSRQATHLSRWLFAATLSPKSLKTPATKSLWTSGGQVWSLPHAYTRGTQAHYSLCALSSSVLLCGYPPSRADNTTALAQQNTDPKIEFQSPYRNSISDQASPRSTPSSHPEFLCDS